MSGFIYKNNANSLIVGTLTTGATTLNVTASEGANFPSTFPFRLTLWDATAQGDPGEDSGMEVVHCTGRATDALTIVRAQEGTADVEHAEGEKVAMLWTAGHFNDVTYGVQTILDAHKSNDGSEHSFIDQSVISGASPTFDGANITNIDADTLIADVKEANVSAVTKGQMCAIVGSSGNKFEVQLCDCDNANIIRALGLVVADTAQNETGQVVHKGLLTNVDTQIGNTDVNPNGETWAAGDMLFVSNTPGGLTNVRPSVGRCIKAGRTLKGNSASDALLAMVHTNDISACAAAGEDLCNRMGDNDGVNKCTFKDYANNEVAAFDSNGNLTLIGNVDGRDVSVDGTKLDTIENDIDYPTAIKQKAITDTGEDGGVEGGMFNGDFEYGSGSRSTSGWIGDEKYGWYVNKDASAVSGGFENGTMKISTTDATGKIDVNSAQAGTINPIHHTVIKPSTKYRLSGLIKTDNVATDSGRLRCIEYNENLGAITINTAPLLSGTNDWTYIEVIFTSNASSVFVRIDIGLSVTGNISDAWFDDIKLEQIDTQAVNTQVDEIVSVSVEGVTTTDNIDQYLETSGNTYTLMTGINEGATHRQTFTPTADRGDGKHILTKIQALVAAVGTGNWTLAVHDAANNTLVNIIVINASMSTGDFDFDTFALLDIGTAYHFHIYSTVADGTVTTTDANDLETVDYHAQFGKHTESPIISANSSKFDLTGVKLLAGDAITVNADGSGRYEYGFWGTSLNTIKQIFSDIDSYSGKSPQYVSVSMAYRFIIDSSSTENTRKFKLPNGYIYTDNVTFKLDGLERDTATRYWSLLYSFDNVNWEYLVNNSDSEGVDKLYTIPASGQSVVYIKDKHESGSAKYLTGILFSAAIICQSALPIFSPSTEVKTETSDLTLNPIDISEDRYWQLNSDLTGWGSRTFTMLASEAAFESQAVSANYIYMYDSNGTTPWTWDERSGLVPPADRTSGTVTAKFLVGDNQIRSSVNDGSMKANVNLSWNEESLRATINRLTALANLQYPIVIEVEDVPAIDLQDQPIGASAETGYTNDVTSLRQTAAATLAIAYTGLLPRENQFSEWLDITVVCSDGDGTLQGKLYTVGGTLIETYADLESNPVITISNLDYKYSRERLILQISASLETTGTAWSITDIKWRYQYNG